tara:strand:- start:71 stop:334 length:264 start_codon:yes stop_codon:yes gene_type:complete
MDTYSFFTRKCVWYNVDESLPSARVYIQNTFNLKKELGDKLIGMSGEEIIKFFEDKEANYDLLEMCAMYMDCYLYRSDMKIIDYNGE